jgi:hypothetical protein
MLKVSAFLLLLSLVPAVAAAKDGPVNRGQRPNIIFILMDNLGDGELGCYGGGILRGAQIPQDRPIDGVDQTDFLLGNASKSKREGFPVYVADRLEAVKWRNWKVVFNDEQRDWWTPPMKLGVPKAFDLITDPKEEYPATGVRNSWNAGPAMKIVTEFEQSLKRYPPIAPGAPDPYTPPN